LESWAWLEDLMIAVGQGPAPLKSRVMVTDREILNYGALLIKDEVTVGIKLDCRWKFSFKTI
jgi:hypothetical protein